MTGNLPVKLLADFSQTVRALGLLKVATVGAAYQTARFAYASGSLEVVRRLAYRERMRQLGLN